MLTLLTVAGSGDAPYLLENLALMRRLNPGAPPPMHVINNSGEALDLPGARVHPGLPRDETLPPSYHHAAALNAFLRAQPVPTRFLLILDPDFYILLPRWVEALPRYLEQRNLALLAAPWHPRWFTKPRRAAAPHCLLIDTAQMNPPALDFTPDLPPLKPARPHGALYSFTLLRRQIGRSRDTGWRIHHPRRKLLTPVFTPAQAMLPHLRHPTGRAFERLLPERLSFLPRNYATRPFIAADWEQFLLDGAPFGLHLRRHGTGARHPPEPKLLDLLRDPAITAL